MLIPGYYYPVMCTICQAALDLDKSETNLGKGWGGNRQVGCVVLIRTVDLGMISGEAKGKNQRKKQKEVGVV